MEDRKIKNQRRAHFVENPILDKLTRTPPYIIREIYFSLPIYYFLYEAYIKIELSTVQIVGLLFFIGIFTWSLTEYLLHRFLMNLPVNSKWVDRFTYLVHGVHHEHPKDKKRLSTPPLSTIIITFLLFSFFYLFLRKYTFALFSGFIISYLLYATIHYLMHSIPYPPKPFQSLLQHHFLHHYKYPDKAFGISNQFWNPIFGTISIELSYNKFKNS